jgi:hypothetical protein
MRFRISNNFVRCLDRVLQLPQLHGWVLQIYSVNQTQAGGDTEGNVAEYIVGNQGQGITGS